MITDQTRLCLTCDKPVKGRTDKKFCDDHCRNTYNNLLKADSNNLVRNVNHALGKNRRILEAILPEGEEMGKVSKENLLQEGFLFKYFTHIYKNKKGSVFLFCYEYGYISLDDDWFLVIKRMDE